MEMLMIFYDIVTDNGVLNPQTPRKKSRLIQFNTRLPDVLLIFSDLNCHFVHDLFIFVHIFVPFALWAFFRRRVPTRHWT